MIQSGVDTLEGNRYTNDTRPSMIKSVSIAICKKTLLFVSKDSLHLIQIVGKIGGDFVKIHYILIQIVVNLVETVSK